MSLLTTRYYNMVACAGILTCFIFYTISVVHGRTHGYLMYQPPAYLEALKSGGFRVYMPHIPGLALLEFHANINEEIDIFDQGKVFGEAREPENGYWIINFPHRLTTRHKIYYYTFVDFKKFNRKKEGTWNVQLIDNYTTLSGGCGKASIIVDENEQPEHCFGQIVFEDQFNGSELDIQSWRVEQKIPTYSEPNYEFNTYENRDDTIFLKNNNLFIKPVALMSEEEVRGTLNLRFGCTSYIDVQCYHKKSSYFLLPPVKSAKIKLQHSFRYGKIEIRAKLPAGDWIVPVIELEPNTKTEESNSSTLWIAYSRGNDYLTNSAFEDIGSRVLFAGPVLHPEEPVRSAKLKQLRSDKRYSDDFHTYSLTWKPGSMKFGYNQKDYHYINTSIGFSDPGIDAQWTDSEAHFDKEYTLVLGVMVGGFNNFPDDYSSPNYPKPWLNTDPNYVKRFFDERQTWSKTWNDDDTALQIDYVRITAE